MDFQKFEKIFLYGTCSMCIYFLGSFYSDTQEVIKDRNTQMLKFETISNDIKDLHEIQVETLKSLNIEISKLNTHSNQVSEELKALKENTMIYQGIKKTGNNGLVLQMGLPGGTSVQTDVNLVPTYGENIK